MSNNQMMIPTREEFGIIQEIIKSASDSAYFKNMGGYPGLMSIALYAREMGVPIMSSLFGGMQNVMGKIQMSPEMMMSLIRGKGHKIEILEDSDVVCKIRGTRKDTGETYTSSYSIGEAQTAGLVKPNSGWAKNPSDMLFARASGRLKRRLFPDVATKAYCEGELEEVHESKTVTMEAVKEIQSDNQEIQSEKVIRFISSDQAQQLNELIGDDEEYYRKLIAWLKIEAFHQLPLARFDGIFNAITRHNEDRKRMEELNA
jgi:hypothetical protein